MSSMMATTPAYDDDKPGSDNNHTNRKKARVGLAMELEMAVPFLSATEDLPQFAAVSKACRDAARDSYQQRTKKAAAQLLKVPTTSSSGSRSSSTDNNNNNSSMTMTMKKIFSKEEAPMCYRNPWWAAKQRKEEAWFHQGWSRHTDPNAFPITVREEDGSCSWTLTKDDDHDLHPPEWLERYYKLVLPPSRQDKLFANDNNTEVVHFSVVDHILLVIFCRWTDRGDEYYNAEETRKQLFGVLYYPLVLPTASTIPPPQQQLGGGGGGGAVVKQQQQQQLLPVFCDKLTEPKDRNNYGSISGIYFGNAIRSRNGKKVAVVTALPLGNEDNIDGDEPRETAEVTIYEIQIVVDDDDDDHDADGSNDKNNNYYCLQQQCTIEVPMGDRTGDSDLTMTLSNGGELLSIKTTRNEFDQDPGFWAVYNLTKTPPERVTHMEEVYIHFENHQFTPDNELLITIQNEHADPKTFFDETEIPSWLAKRMIVVQRDVHEYYD